MNKEQVKQLMQDAETRFNELNQFNESIKTRLKDLGLVAYEDISAEMNRLQGDFRTLDSILQTLETTAPVNNDAALTINATPKEEQDNAGRSNEVLPESNTGEQSE